MGNVPEEWWTSVQVRSPRRLTVDLHVHFSWAAALVMLLFFRERFMVRPSPDAVLIRLTKLFCYLHHHSAFGISAISLVLRRLLRTRTCDWNNKVKIFNIYIFILGFKSAIFCRRHLLKFHTEDDADFNDQIRLLPRQTRIQGENSTTDLHFHASRKIVFSRVVTLSKTVLCHWKHALKI